jgi:hypothetical protein
MGLINENLNSELDTLVGQAFLGNRILDRAMSILNVKFVMNNSVKYLHTGFAHLYPLLADQISDYQGSRNNLTGYPDTPADFSDYDTPLSFFEKLLDYQVNYEESVKEVVKTAMDLGDFTTEAFLKSYLLTLNKYTEQIILLRDKAKEYGNNHMAFDKDIKKFFLFGGED